MIEIGTLLDTFYGWVWGAPLMVLLVGIGTYLTIRLHGIQFTHLKYALELAFGFQKGKEGKGDISHFESLMTALAATIGIGNIAGVATAISVGGMGALFWMWMTALIGMAIKYAEAILAVKYRTTDEYGEMCGGPMYFIEYGLGWKWLAISFAVFGAIGAFGGGNMLQANSVADVLYSMFHIDPWITGVVVALLCGATLLGGIKSIGKVAGYLVPFMAIMYIGGAFLILAKHVDKIPGAIGVILEAAFTGQAAVGGFLGSTVLMAIQVGVSRGLMTSEAGSDCINSCSSSAYRSSRKTSSGINDRLLSCNHCYVYCNRFSFSRYKRFGKEGLKGASMTLEAFQSVFPWGGIVVTIGLVLFAFTTLIGWAYYGEKCVEYLFGARSVPFYRVIFTLIIIPGAVLELDLVWKISDICNGLMAFPNLIGLCALSPVVIAETKAFLRVLAHESSHNTNDGTDGTSR